MAKESLLSPGEVDIIETAKAKRQLKKERKQLVKAKQELKADTVGSKVKKAFFAKPSKSPKRKIFGSAPVQESYTREQSIMRGMFGHGSRVMTNFDGRSLPKINNTLNSGGGLLKSGDTNRGTAAIFGF